MENPEGTIAQLTEKIRQIEDERFLQNLSQAVEKYQAESVDLLAQGKEALQKVSIAEGEKEKFFSIISFWLGSPLNSLHMLSKMLVGDVEALPPAMLKEMAQHLFNQVNKLKGTMANLITWSDLSVGNFNVQPKAFDLYSIAQSAFAPHQEHADKKGIVLSNSVSENQKAFGDPTYIEQVLSNLVSNGVKFSVKEKEVSIRAEMVEGKLKISVTDQGIGMGKAKLAKVFNPERKATQKGTAQEEGFGLGLIVSKKILELHNADLLLESERGKGTAAFFELEQEEPQA